MATNLPHGRVTRPARVLAVALCLWQAAFASAAEVALKDGRVLKGSLAPLSSIGADPNAAADVQLVLMVDNGLSRTFVPKYMIDLVTENDTGDIPEVIRIDQQIPSGGFPIAGLGPIIRVTEFDDFGRRILTMNTISGPIDVIQGITMITPVWTKVEALRKYKLDMRIATSSIPRETLRRIIQKQAELGGVPDGKLEAMLKVVRLFMQAGLYKEARDELNRILEEYPERKEDYATAALLLRQRSARRLLSEIKLLKSAGQHQRAYTFLSQFPTDDVAGEILQEVRELLEEYQALKQKADGVLPRLKAHVAALTDSDQKLALEPIIKEIEADLNIHTLDRMAAYLQLADAATLLPPEKVSLAVSGWLLGSDGATEKLSVSLSLYQVRRLLIEYLNDPLKLDRDRIVKTELVRHEGATPALVARLLAHMKPPLQTPEPETPGWYTLEVPGWANNAPVSYYVQLPPEYNPYRRYPAVVTLHGAGTTPQHQVDWWAGALTENGVRAGQATRHGYIVIAPHWGREHQKQYGYSAAEHAAILNSLRDACKRFAIDVDQVFLSGHSMGGDAAWDIGLAHPDLWAGVIPVVAVSDKYCAHYWPNAKGLPLYFVGGELDGDKSVQNARELDRYFIKAGYNPTVVEFLGRGHEHFSDEILNIFDWMGRQRRNFYSMDFSTASMRPWDNYFWWLELDDFPERAMVDPVDWPPRRGTRAILTEATVRNNNTINVKTGAGRVSVWLSPELVDFNQPITATVNGGRLGSDRFVEPSLEVLLEDVRTRGDRQHPFWARLETPDGRSRAALLRDRR